MTAIFKSRLRIIIAVTLLLVVVLAVWSLLIEPNRLVLHAETITLPNWPAALNGFKIAAIGDIHTGSPFIDSAKLRQIVALTNSQQPDLIVLLGDYMVRDRAFQTEIDPEVTAGVLQGLHAPLGVYAY